MPSLTNAWFKTWQAKLRSASLTSLRSTKVLCAFNALIDKTIQYNPDTFSKLLAHFERDFPVVTRKSRRKISRIDSPQLLFASLVNAFRTGKAMHVPTNFSLLQWLENNFPSASASIGGQAGIIANQVALLGGKTILYTNQLSPQLAHLFSPRVKFPKVEKDLHLVSFRHAGNKSEKTRVNWIIEFKKGDVLNFGGSVFVAPRSNRLILSSPYSQPPLFDDKLVHFLPELGQQADAGIVSGYHALQPIYEDGSTYEYYLSVEELYLKMLKSHKNIPLHLEYVSTPFKEVDKAIYEHITKHVDSFGLNEIETVELVEKLGFPSLARDIVKSENSVSLHAAGEKIMEKLQLKRLHLHNLGYHLVLLKKPLDAVHQAKQVNSVLFGSLAATSRALHGREITRGEVQDALTASVSENALREMARMCSHLSLSRSVAEHSLLTSAFDMDSHVLLIVPGQVAPLTRRTTGLGDVVSSCSFLAGL